MSAPSRRAERHQEDIEMTIACPALRAGLAGLLLLAAAGCENIPIDKRTQGQIAGGVTGAAVGSMFGGGTGRLIATGAGAVLGSIAGGKIADEMN
jgi:hypothetical protein